MHKNKIRSYFRNSSKTSIFLLLILTLLVCDSSSGISLAQRNTVEKKPESPDKECIIKSLAFFNEVSRKEAMNISKQYNVAIDHFYIENCSMLRKTRGLGAPNPPVKNEDELLSLLGGIHSHTKIAGLIDVLLDRINKKQRPDFSANRKLFFYENRPAFHALVLIGPNAAHAAIKKIGSEPDKEKRYYISLLLWRLLGKKFALLYLDDAQKKVESDSTLSDKMKAVYKSRYSNVNDELKKMKDKKRVEN